jgi:hypothetical protein
MNELCLQTFCICKRYFTHSLQVQYIQNYFAVAAKKEGNQDRWHNIFLTSFIFSDESSVSLNRWRRKLCEMKFIYIAYCFLIYSVVFWVYFLYFWRPSESSIRYSSIPGGDYLETHRVCRRQGRSRKPVRSRKRRIGAGFELGNRGAFSNPGKM